MQQDAVDMITSLSVFFRTSLSKGKDIIPLSEEKRHTLSYLEIQQSRYRDIMEFEINIPPELDEVMVPKLTLQPLAENALYHGIKNKRGKGKILIEIDDFLQSLPFGLTEAQLRSVQEICHDLAGTTPMNRLLQGDVGSGKTVVAACACVFAARNHTQSALMAPTEIR